MNNTASSALLRLPGEIRNMIWRLVLGDHLIHLRWIFDDEYEHLIKRYFKDLDSERIRLQKLGHRHLRKPCLKTSEDIRRAIGSSPWRHAICEMDCPGHPESIPHTKCHESLKYCYAEITGRSYGITVRKRREDLIPADFLNHKTIDFPLLLVCKQVIREAISFLYETNTFSFDDSSTFRQWMARLPLHHRHSVNSMRLDIRLAHNWKSVLNLPKVKTLRSLRCLILQVDPADSAEHVKEIQGRISPRETLAVLWWHHKYVESVEIIFGTDRIDGRR